MEFILTLKWNCPGSIHSLKILSALPTFRTLPWAEDFVAEHSINQKSEKSEKVNFFGEVLGLTKWQINEFTHTGTHVHAHRLILPVSVWVWPKILYRFRGPKRRILLFSLVWLLLTHHDNRNWHTTLTLTKFNRHGYLRRWRICQNQQHVVKIPHKYWPLHSGYLALYQFSSPLIYWHRGDI